MPQHRDLDIVGTGSLTGADHPEDPSQDKERQCPHHHGSRSARSASPLLTAAR
jgi:hypothetical protein